MGGLTGCVSDTGVGFRVGSSSPRADANRLPGRSITAKIQNDHRESTFVVFVRIKSVINDLDGRVDAVGEWHWLPAAELKTPRV
jgi:hypothetical protein